MRSGSKASGVLVAGAGPVGLVTALKLARAGIPVTVIDAEPQVPTSPRGVACHSPTIAELERIGILDDVKAVAITKRDYQFRTLDGTVLAQIDLAVIASETAHPYDLHLGQHVLVGIMLKHLLGLPGVAMRWNTRLVGVAQCDDGIMARVRTAQGMEYLPAAWLVGADGTCSAVRQALGLAFHGYTWLEQLVAADVRYDFEAQGYARTNFILDPVDWAMIPVLGKQGLWRVAYCADSGISDAGIRERAPERITRILNGATSFAIDHVAPFRIHQRAAERFRMGRVVLAGDAAHASNPCGGLGFTSGLLDAVHLGDALAAVIRADAPEAVLDEYAMERRRIFLTVTSPRATENKRRLCEVRPARRQVDRAWLRKLHRNKQLQRQFLLSAQQLKSKPYHYAPE